MITALMFLMPLVAHTEKLTLTSGLTIEAQYLPDEDAFLIPLESFGALTADLELAGPSCTKRIDAVKAECQSALDDALKRAEERQAELYDAWTKDQVTLTKLTNQLRDVDQERIMWRWFALGLGAIAFTSTGIVILSN